MHGNMNVNNLKYFICGRFVPLALGLKLHILMRIFYFNV